MATIYTDISSTTEGETITLNMLTLKLYFTSYIGDRLNTEPALI
jgi:hypothetical protein